MKKEIIAATHNKNKIIEFERILRPKGITVLPPPDPEFLKTILENGETFEENALIKARALFQKTGRTVLADDSGLCVDALGGAPGIYSARYLGEETPYHSKMAGILNEIAGISDHLRTARFKCAIAVVGPVGERTFSGEWEGLIGHEPKGGNGFGYDPIFYVGDRSFSELSDGEKDEISHRAKAMMAMCSEIENLISFD